MQIALSCFSCGQTYALSSCLEAYLDTELGVGCRRIVRVPADAVAGSQHVIGVLPYEVDVHDAKENADSLLLRLLDKSEVTHCQYLELYATAVHTHVLATCVYDLVQHAPELMVSNAQRKQVFDAAWIITS